jgi:hypothetical protein
MTTTPEPLGECVGHGNPHPEHYICMFWRPLPDAQGDPDGAETMVTYKMADGNSVAGEFGWGHGARSRSDPSVTAERWLPSGVSARSTHERTIPSISLTHQ